MSPISRRRGRRKIIRPRSGTHFNSCLWALERRGIPIVKKLPKMQMLVAEVEDDAAVLEALGPMQQLVQMEEDLRVRICSPADGLYYNIVPQQIPWGIDYIGARKIEDKGSQKVGVAILDTGIDASHPDLRGLVNGGTNTVNPEEDPIDRHGHGTHVAGTIAALDNEFGVRGIKPNTDLYAVKVLEDSGEGYLSDLIEGLQWVADNNIQIVNMSLSADKDTPAFRTAISNVYRRGTSLVAAAGNGGQKEDSVEFPARYPEVIAVGAIDRQGRLAEFSSRGAGLDILAPGVSVLSTWRGGTYAIKKGTSMAAPHVTGTLALMMSHSRQLRPAQLKQILMQTATRGSAAQAGVGIVNAAEAVRAVTLYR